MATVEAKRAHGGLGAAVTGSLSHWPSTSAQSANRRTTQRALDAPAGGHLHSKPAAPRPDTGDQAQDYVNMPYLSRMDGVRRVEQDQARTTSGQAMIAQRAPAATPVSQHASAPQVAGPVVYPDSGFQPGMRPPVSAMLEPFNASPAIAPLMPSVIGSTSRSPSAGAAGGLLSAVWAASEKGHQRSKSSDWSAAANHLAAVNDARRAQLHGGEPLLDSGEWLAESLLAEIR